MAIKRKPQTEEKAKGLIGWKNGRQVTTSKDSTANRNVGDYKASKGKSGRTLNLTNKQLGASGRRAAASATVDISKTTFDKSKGGVLGPKGKPLTGRVDLGGGNIAVYRNGVRVRASSTKSKGGNGGGGGNGGDGPPKKKYGTPYEERKAAIGSGTTKGKPRGAGVPYEERKQAIGGGNARPNMNAPYRSGKTKPLPGITAAERKYNNSAKARAYPSRASNEASDKATERALIMASLIPGIGVATRVGMGVRAGAAAINAGRTAAAARAALPAAMTRATPTAAARAKDIATAASKAGVKVKPSTKPATKPQYVGNNSRNTGRAGEIERAFAATRPAVRQGPAAAARPAIRTTRSQERAAMSRNRGIRPKAPLTPAQKAARTRAANKAKKEGKK